MNRSIASLLAFSALVAAPAAAFGEEGERPLDKALEKYWGEERDPPAVLNRLHPRAARTEVSAFAGTIPDDAFRSYVVPGATVTHFLADSFSLGLSAAFPQSSLSDLGGFLNDTFPKIDYLERKEQYKMLLTLDAGWVPFYGKMSLLGYKLAHFDLGLYAGVGAAQTTFLERGIDEESNGMTIGFDLGVGMRFYITKWVTIRVDYREHFVKSRLPDGGFDIPTVFSVGIGSMFPYPEELQ